MKVSSTQFYALRLLAAGGYIEQRRRNHQPIGALYLYSAPGFWAPRLRHQTFTALQNGGLIRETGSSEVVIDRKPVRVCEWKISETGHAALDVQG